MFSDAEQIPVCRNETRRASLDSRGEVRVVIRIFAYTRGLTPVADHPAVADVTRSTISAASASSGVTGW